MTYEINTHSHCPLILVNNEIGRQWTLRVQDSPQHAITLTGVDPTFEEIVRALSSISAPAWMCYVVVVLAKCATRVDK